MNKIQLVTLIALLSGVGVFSDCPLRAQSLSPTPDTDKKIEELFKLQEYFVIDSANIVVTPELRRLSVEVDSIVKADTVTAAEIKGYASIDGPVAFNLKLAKARAEAMSGWLTESTSIPSGLIHISSDGEPWGMFRDLVYSDPNMPLKTEVLGIIDSNKEGKQKQTELRALQKGAVWSYLAKNIFPPMRMAEVSLYGYPKVIPIPDERQPELMEEPAVEMVEEVVVAQEVTEPEYWTRKIYVKTNAPAWLMLWINAAFEIDMAPHWSFAFPIYYSGFNYFKRNLKFRTFSVVPEFRWWPRSDNMGFFLNGHLGLNLFNYAKGGEWRYQTYKGHTPALGGGIGLGYRWYFCKNHRWSMEAGIGAGVYHLDYSIFQNIYNGLIVGRRIRTIFCLDQASLSFAYSFGVQRKEVKK